MHVLFFFLFFLREIKILFYREHRDVPTLQGVHITKALLSSIQITVSRHFRKFTKVPSG